MNILFDVPVKWQRTPADYIPENSERSYYGTPSHRLILVCKSGILAAELNGGVYDCAIGDHDGLLYPDYVLPMYTGLVHSKITVFKPAEHHDMLLSDVLAGCPTGIDGRHWSDPITMTVRVQPALRQLLTEYAYRYFGEQPRNVDDLIGHAILEYVENRE